MHRATTDKRYYIGEIAAAFDVNALIRFLIEFEFLDQRKRKE
jgi:hypothetical protein